MKRVKGRFTSEGLKGNVFAKGNKPNKTTFKKGQFVGENHPSWKGGNQVMKKDCVYVNIGSNKRERRPKLVWEEVNGKLPEGFVIIHLDEDRYNDDIENLEAISRKELLARNRKKRYE